MNLGKEILNRMPDNLSDLEKARYLYLELCKVVSFSTTFQNTDMSNFAVMYHRKEDVSKLSSTEINCRIWSQLYSQLLNSVGIQNRIVDRGHSHVEFYVEGKKWVADATYGSYTDLSRIKNDDDTIGFGYSAYQDPKNEQCIISTDEKYSGMLRSADDKLGYNTDRKRDLVEFKEYLKSIREGKYDITGISEGIVCENPLTFKLEHLFASLGKLNSGYYEAKDFVYHLEHQLFTSEELARIGAVELKRTNADKSVDILQCIYIKGDNPSYYLLSPSLPVKKIDASQVMSLALKGYGIEEGKKIPGINYPRMFVQGEVFKVSKFKLWKENLFKTHDDPLEEYTARHI